MQYPATALTYPVLVRKENYHTDNVMIYQVKSEERMYKQKRGPSWSSFNKYLRDEIIKATSPNAQQLQCMSRQLSQDLV